MCCSVFFFKCVTEVQRSIPAQAGMGLERVPGEQELVSWGTGRTQLRNSWICRAGGLAWGQKAQTGQVTGWERRPGAHPHLVRCGALQRILSQGDGGAADQPKVTLLLSVHWGPEPRQSIIRIQVSTHRTWLHQSLDLLTREPRFLAVITLRQHAFAPFSFLHLPLLCMHPKVLFILLWGR